MSHDAYSFLGLAIMAPLVSNQAFILKYSWSPIRCLALRRLSAWSSCRRLALQQVRRLVYMFAPYWARGSLVGSLLGQHQTYPSVLVDHQQTASKKRHNNKRLGPNEPSTTKYCITSILVQGSVPLIHYLVMPSKHRQTLNSMCETQCMPPQAIFTTKPL